jgi:hypothetical protein
MTYFLVFVGVIGCFLVLIWVGRFFGDGQDPNDGPGHGY